MIPVIAAGYYLWHRLGSSPVARVYAWAAILPVMALFQTELSQAASLVGCVYFGLGLLLAGRGLGNLDFQWQSYVVAAFTFSYVIAIPQPVWAAAAIIAAFYAGQALSERHPRTFLSILATVLLSATLYNEISGSVLTLALGGEGLLLLAAGFLARERLLRLEGLILFLICVLKVFIYDMRKLETMYYILSIIALGAILIAVSWIYTRFRDQVRRYL